MNAEFLPKHSNAPSIFDFTLNLLMTSMERAFWRTPLLLVRKIVEPTSRGERLGRFEAWEVVPTWKLWFLGWGGLGLYELPSRAVGVGRYPQG